MQFRETERKERRKVSASGKRDSWWKYRGGGRAGLGEPSLGGLSGNVEMCKEKGRKDAFGIC